METKFNESTPQRPEGDRVVDDNLVAINLPEFMEQLKKESTWADSDRNAITVYKTDGLRMVLVGLHKGAEMPRHTADGILNVQVLEGAIVFSTDQANLRLAVGHVAALHKNLPHSVKAETDSFFLLTLTTKPDPESAENSGDRGKGKSGLLYEGL